MDNPSSESSTSALDTNQAAAVFADLLEPKEPEQEQPEAPEVESEAPEPEATEPEEQEVEADDDPLVTIKIDGKDVEVKLSELKNGYQRQADYTRKTMEVSEQRKAAEAEYQKAHQERQAYAQNLQRMQAQIEGALQEQSQIDWQQLLESDPVEYLKQQHLAQQRQAALQDNYRQQQALSQLQQAEAQKAYQSNLMRQQEELLAKLPDWKDESKAKAEKAALRSYLIEQGFDEQSVNQVSDAKAVVMARKAMLYDQMVSKAQAAAKKVATLPTKVERPGVGTSQNLDKRSSAFQRLSKSGRVEDAAAVFASFL